MKIEKWTPQVGEEVVILVSWGWHGLRIMGKEEVAKVGKRDIVLTDGRRFRVSDLHEQGKDRYRSSFLVSPADPRIAGIEAKEKVDDAKSTAHGAVDLWLHNRDSLPRLREAITAMQAYEQVLSSYEDED